MMNANGGYMKCGGHCENVRVQMGDYSLKTHMFDIQRGVCDISLWAEWLRKTSPITVGFHELYISFQHEGDRYTFKGLIADSPKIISSHHMENIHKKGDSCIVVQFHAI
jgi:hypothetical protein